MVIPAVDLMDGNCVQLVGGDASRRRMERDDPVEVALGFQEAGARYLHVIDLDRALGRGDNRDAVRELVAAVDVPVQVGGGLRTGELVAEMLEAGADRVIVGTRAVRDVDWLGRMSGAHGGRIVVAIDARGDEILVRGWREGSGRDLMEYSALVDGMDLAGFLFTNVALEGRLRGTDPGVVAGLVASVERPVMAAGGVTTMEDLEELEAAGVAGAVVGSALYEGEIDLELAVERFG